MMIIPEIGLCYGYHIKGDVVEGTCSVLEIGQNFIQKLICKT
jgi:hypothetical protein